MQRSNQKLYLYTGQTYDPEQFELVKGGWSEDHCAICWWKLTDVGRHLSTARAIPTARIGCVPNATKGSSAQNARQICNCSRQNQARRGGTLPAAGTRGYGKVESSAFALLAAGPGFAIMADAPFKNQ